MLASGAIQPHEPRPRWEVRPRAVHPGSERTGLMPFLEQPTNLRKDGTIFLSAQRTRLWYPAEDCRPSPTDPRLAMFRFVSTAPAIPVVLALVLAPPRNGAPTTAATQQPPPRGSHIAPSSFCIFVVQAAHLPSAGAGEPPAPRWSSFCIFPDRNGWSLLSLESAGTSNPLAPRTQPSSFRIFRSTANPVRAGAAPIPFLGRSKPQHCSAPSQSSFGNSARAPPPDALPVRAKEFDWHF